MIGHLALTHWPHFLVCCHQMTPFLNSQPIFDNLRLGTKNRIFDKIFKSVLNFVKILEFLLNIQYAQIFSLHGKLNKFLEWPSIMKKYLSPKDP